MKPKHCLLIIILSVVGVAYRIHLVIVAHGEECCASSTSVDGLNQWACQTGNYRQINRVTIFPDQQHNVYIHVHVYIMYMYI